MNHVPPARTARKVPAQITPISASPRRRRFPSTSLTIGSWPSATAPEKTNQSTPIAGSLTCAHHRDPGADEDDVQDDVAKEDPVPEHVDVAPRLVVRLDVPWRGNQAQDCNEHQKRRRVEQEEEGEGARVIGSRDRARDQPAEGDAQVHGHPLLREGGMTPLLRGERAEQGGLAGPEGAAAEADEHVQPEGLPGRADQREERERHRHQDEGCGQHPSRSESIGECAADEPRHQRRGRVGSDDESGNPERDAAHVVQVDDQERSDHPVPEHVREPARLQDPDVPRQLRIEAAEVGPHRASLARDR